MLNPSGAGQVPPVGGQVLESCLNFFILYPLTFIHVLTFTLVFCPNGGKGILRSARKGRNR